MVYVSAMAKISLIATVTAVEGKGTELRDALVNLIACADEEPGCEIYSVHADRNDPDTFHFFELYTDRDALKAHGTGERMSAAMAELGGLLAGPPAITRLEPVAAKGLDL